MTAYTLEGESFTKLSCGCCNRRFRSKASAEAAARFKAIHDDLRLSRKITYSTTPDLTKSARQKTQNEDWNKQFWDAHSPSKQQNHRAQSQNFRRRGEI